MSESPTDKQLAAKIIFDRIGGFDPSANQILVSAGGEIPVFRHAAIRRYVKEILAPFEQRLSRLVFVPVGPASGEPA